MWNPFKKKDPLEGQRANYALAFDIVPKVLNAFNREINGVHREVMCWHLLSTTHAGCNTRELIPLWHLLGRLPLASRLAVAHGEVHR